MKIHTTLAGSSILYHATYIDRAIKILSEQVFRLRPTTGNKDEEKVEPNIYFLSTTRSLVSHYFLNVGPPIVFQLDGNKLSSRYRVKPVNFFSDKSRQELGELEDRVFSTKPYISTKYVVSIHVPLLGHHKSTEIKIGQLHRLAIKSRIPIYFYLSKRVHSTNPKYRVRYRLEKNKETPLPLPGDNVYRSPVPQQDTELKTLRANAQAVVDMVIQAPTKKLYRRVQKFVDVLVDEDRVHGMFHHYNGVTDILQPVIAKMRTHNWSIDALYRYIYSKLKYLKTGSTYTTDLLYADTEADLKKIHRRMTAYTVVADMFLAKEYGIEPEMLKRVQEAGGPHTFYGTIA